MLCVSNDRSCLTMANVGSLAMGVAAGVATGVAAGVVTGAVSSSDDS